MEEFITIETKMSKRNTDIFNWLRQAIDEEKQLNNYIIKKLGKDHTHIEIYPKKRKKFPCPENCDNTYIWITDKYIKGEFQIIKATCAHCDTIFLIFQKHKSKSTNITNSFNNNSGSINFNA